MRGSGIYTATGKESSDYGAGQSVQGAITPPRTWRRATDSARLSFHNRCNELGCPHSKTAGNFKLMVVLMGRRLVEYLFGFFCDFLEQHMPFFVEFTKSQLAVIQVLHKTQKSEMQADRNLARTEIDARRSGVYQFGYGA